MYAVAVGRVLRMLRLRRDWRQSDVAARARVSSSAVGRHENGFIGSLDIFERHAAVFGLRVDVRVLGRAGSLLRLGDEEHARIVEAVAAWFRDHGFLIEAEASFSEWGERGRMDLLAFEPATGTLAIVEAKTQLLDLQNLFGSLNVKERLAATIAQRRSWHVVRRVTVLAVANTSVNRRLVREHPSLFAEFGGRHLTVNGLRNGGRRIHWVNANRGGTWLSGRQRVSRRRVNFHHRGLETPGAPPSPSRNSLLPGAEG